jgi:predicted trehalose synthase
LYSELLDVTVPFCSFAPASPTLQITLNVATDGACTGEAQLSSLIGYLTWRVAAGILRGIVGSVSNDAQWGTYLTVARSAGLTLVGEISLTDQATRYWKIRHEHELFQNSKDGWFEHHMYKAFQEGWVNYKLYIWTRN